MLQEAIDIQQNAVADSVHKLTEKKEITFRAPTGSGKTRMMVDFMNRILNKYPNVVFVVSTLSKGGLAEQNYNVFNHCAHSGVFPSLNPYLINSESNGEERLFIPLGYNVYVLPRDLYKDNSKLKDQGVLVGFLNELTKIVEGEQKWIYLIKDECHQATNNLDSLSDFFQKVINFSATPNLKRGQNPDVKITDKDAEQAKLIKQIEWGKETDTVEDAICKFEEIKETYRNLLSVNPCLIIQISNKEKAEDEWTIIKNILNKIEHIHLKWMSIVDKKEKCDTNDSVCKLKVDRWKDYAKENASTIDVIVFKMVISEGWDIPRACMLYQVRDTKSKQLDEQVIGRVRRNPRLIDFEKLSVDAQKLAMTAWIWGIKPDNEQKMYKVNLFGAENDITSVVKIKVTRLKQLTERADFDIEKFILAKGKDVVSSSIFNLFSKLQQCENDVKELCYEYADEDVQKWYRFTEIVESINREYNKYICDYSKSMVVAKNEDGTDYEVSFPLTSSYSVNDKECYEEIADWIWKRKDNSREFHFDSYAERKWAIILKNLPSIKFENKTVTEPNPMYGRSKADGTTDYDKNILLEKHLWGKNFLQNSEIKFEYYLNGIHTSYPDFVMKDKNGNIHLFEIKSVNTSNQKKIDSEEYKEKIRALIECYKHSSRLTNYYFYLPILKDDIWQITRCHKGKSDTITEEQFKESF